MALAATFGLSFSNILGQDTIDTVVDVIDNLDEPEKLSHGGGILGNIMPPEIDDLMRAGMLFGLINFEKSDTAEILLGDRYVNFRDRDRYTEMFRLLNVNVAKLKQDYDRGFGMYSVLRHVGITKQDMPERMHEGFEKFTGAGKGGKKKTKKKKPEPNELLAALQRIRQNQIKF
jgi:hypothetical protein